MGDVRMARECLLEMFANASWDTDTDLSVDEVAVTRHTVTVSEHDLAQLVEALGIHWPVYGTARDAIEAALRSGG